MARGTLERLMRGLGTRGWFAANGSSRRTRTRLSRAQMTSAFFRRKKAPLVQCPFIADRPNKPTG